MTRSLSEQLVMEVLYVVCCICLFLPRISSAALSGAMGRVTITTCGFACRFSGNVEVVRCYKP